MQEHQSCDVSALRSIEEVSCEATECEMDAADSDVQLELNLLLTDEDDGLHHHEIEDEFEEEANDLLFQVAIPLG